MRKTYFSQQANIIPPAWIHMCELNKFACGIQVLALPLLNLFGFFQQREVAQAINNIPVFPTCEPSHVCSCVVPPETFPLETSYMVSFQ